MFGWYLKKQTLTSASLTLQRLLHIIIYPPVKPGVVSSDKLI